MKITTVKPIISQNLVVGKSLTNNKYQEVYYEKNFKNFILPVPMTDQEVAPPLHVWDKIARILDEQDSKKQFHKQLSHRSFESQTFVRAKSANNNKIGLAFLGAVAIMGILWFLVSLS